MPKLSVCIPVEPGFSPPDYLAKQLLKKAGTDIQVIVAPFGDTCAEAAALYELAENDPRLLILPPAPPEITAGQFWLGTIAAATGDWVTLVYPDDMLEPDMPEAIEYVEATYPEADAIGWNAFAISNDASREIKANVPVPVTHHFSMMDKAKMLDAFFQWTDGNQTPKMPFGLFHGALKKSLIETIRSAEVASSWLTTVPRYEWAARVVLFANGLALANRPMSAASIKPYTPVPVRSALEGFPLDGGIGLTAAIAEVQARVLAELGSAWNGFNEAFVRACVFDCMLEHDRTAFEIKCRSYHAALQKMPGGEQLIALFRPQYYPQLPDDKRRGLHGSLLLVDRFIGNAKTAQEFYNVMRSIIAPVFVVTGKSQISEAERDQVR